jgi:hypothetical protein
MSRLNDALLRKRLASEGGRYHREATPRPNSERKLCWSRRNREYSPRLVSLLTTVIVGGYMYIDDTFYYFNCLQTGGLYAIVYGQPTSIRSLMSIRKAPNMEP